MSSDKHKHLAQLRANLAQNLNAPSALKNLFRVQYDSIVNSASKDVVLEPELLVESPRATNIKPGHQAGALRQLTVRSRVPEVNDKGIYVDKQHQSGRATVGGRAGAKEAYKEPGSFEKSLFKLSSLQTSPTSPLSTASTLADKLVTTTLQLAKVTVPWDKVFIRSTVQIPAYPLITEHAGKIYYVAPTSRSPSFTALLAPLRRYGTTDQTLVIPEPSSESLSSASTREPQLHIPEKVPIVIQAAPQTLNAQSLTPSSLPTVPATSLDTPVTAEALRQVAETSEGLEDDMASPTMLSSYTSLSSEGFSAHLQSSPVHPVLVGESGTGLTQSTPLQGSYETGPDGHLKMAQQPSGETGADHSEGIISTTVNETSVYRVGKRMNQMSTTTFGPSAFHRDSLVSGADLQPVMNSPAQSAAPVITNSQDGRKDRQRKTPTAAQKDLQPEREALGTTILTDLGDVRPRAGWWETAETDVASGYRNKHPLAEQSSTAPSDAASRTTGNDTDQPVKATEHTDGTVSTVLESLISITAGRSPVPTPAHLQSPLATAINNSLPLAVPGPVPSAPHHNLVEIRPDDPPPLGSLKRRPVCPYPPLPAHGTFFFRTVPNPAPLQYKHYVQYSCYAGYTLAHGDVYSYCLHSGKWSGVTPACLEVTPCSINNGGCSQICKLGLLGRAECSCREGFELLEDNSTCRDVDECADELHRCQQACVNTFGSYECGCGPSYLLSEDERSCSDRDECAINNGGCLHHCANSAGSFRCLCEPGFQLANDQRTCHDVDECQLPIGTAGCLFGCINTPGSFRCHCPEGYRLGTAHGHCIDIDECAENSGRGPCAMECHNAPGSFRCSCAYGYKLAGDGRSCVAECPSGYRKHGNATGRSREHCIDIDECEEPTWHQRRCEWKCVNLPGSHRCICPRGFRLGSDAYHCQDINECESKNGGCSHICINHKGGYRCACPELHRFSPYSRKKCQPVKT
ncbi:uncharacterized protein LOC136750800 [Amia ocellicauda]|uniref:uncharacterized protein LOC136750800 n=1 Tax=Amia ocellicauda TaxID=2972642 RepID=UPI0034646675